MLARRYRWMRQLPLVAIGLALIETAILQETRWLHLPTIDSTPRITGSRLAGVSQRVVAQASTGGAQLIIADDYMTAALLSFYLPGQPEVYVPATSRPLNQLELWADYEQKYPAASALVVDKRARHARLLHKTFDQIKPIGSIQLIDGERRLGQYRLFLASHQYARPGGKPTAGLAAKREKLQG